MPDYGSLNMLFGGNGIPQGFDPNTMIGSGWDPNMLQQLLGQYGAGQGQLPIGTDYPLANSSSMNPIIPNNYLDPNNIGQTSLTQTPTTVSPVTAVSGDASQLSNPTDWSSLLGSLTQPANTLSDQENLGNVLRNAATQAQTGGLSAPYVNSMLEQVYNPLQEKLLGNLNKMGGGVTSLAAGQPAELQRRLMRDFQNQLIINGFNNQNQAAGSATNAYNALNPNIRFDATGLGSLVSSVLGGGENSVISSLIPMLIKLFGGSEADKAVKESTQSGVDVNDILKQVISQIDLNDIVKMISGGGANSSIKGPIFDLGQYPTQSSPSFIDLGSGQWGGYPYPVELGNMR